VKNDQYIVFTALFSTPTGIMSPQASPPSRRPNRDGSIQYSVIAQPR
jgi:hypothetical protein